MLLCFKLFAVLCIGVVFTSCDQFKCEYLNPLKEKFGDTVYVPEKSSVPVPVPANFNCTIDFFVPKDAYLRLTIINSLIDKDYIQFSDSVGYSRTLTISNIANEELFATSGKGKVKLFTGPEGNSRALLKFEWMKMPNSVWNENLQKNESGKNVNCTAIQQNPITFNSDIGEKVALSIAHSGFILDNFDSYFIFDGPTTASQVVGRMSSHVVVPYIPSGQSVTVIGLTSQDVHSNIIANIQSNLVKYRKYEAAVVLGEYGGPLDSINQTIAVTFISKSTNQLYITSLKFNEVENDLCQVRIISGTPSPVSQYLISYTPLSSLNTSFPQQFPASQFSIELSDCSIYMVITKDAPSDFFVANGEREGYVFTPSFLDNQQSSTLNFTLSSIEILHYSTVVESVNVVDGEQLAISVYNSKGLSAMSVVVTGNQTGGSAEAIGTSVNINFNGTKGHGRAKIRYHISKISGTFLPLKSILITMCIMLYF